jgi:hypothetical protein
MIRGLIADAGVQALVIVVIKIVGHGGLRVSQVGKNRPLAQFEDLRLEACPEALSLGIVVAVTAPALRAHSLVVVEQLAVRFTAVLPTAVGVNEQARRGRLGLKSTLQGRGNQLFGHGGHYLPTQHLLADHILIGVQVGPLAVGQRQVGAIADPYLISLRRLGLVKQSVRGAPQPVRRVGGAWGEGLGLERVQAPSAHGGA